MKKELAKIWGKIEFKGKAKAQLAYFLTLLCLVGLGIALSKVPNVLDVDFIRKTYYISIYYFVAEKSEKLQYIILTICFPLFYILFNKLLNLRTLKKEENEENKVSNIFNACFIVGFLIIFYAANRAQLDYCSASILTSNPLVLILIMPVCVFAVWYYQNLSLKKIQAIDFICYGIPVIMIFIISYLYINPNLQQSGYLATHADAYYYPVLKVSSGLTPCIDFNSLYGFYPYFYSLLLKIMGGHNNLYHFSIIVAFLLAISLFCLLLAIYRFIKNKIIALLTITAAFFPLIFYSFIQNEAPYLQYVPHRILFPSIYICYIGFYIDTKDLRKRKILKYIGFLISSFAILWNLDTGIIVFIAQILLLCYELLFSHSLKQKKTYKSLLYILCLALGSLLLSVLIINIITFVRTGKIINPKNFLAAQLLFYGSGFYMLRMPLWHPWMILVLIYSIGLAKSLNNIFMMKRKDKTEPLRDNIILFIIPVLGMGLFSYYQGRSHNQVFMLCCYPGIILLGILADRIYTETRIQGTHFEWEHEAKRFSGVIAIILLCCISLSSFHCFATSKALWSYADKAQLKKTSVIEDRIATIKEITNNQTTKMDFLTGMDSFYYEEFGLKDEKPFPAVIDLFTYEDYNKIINYLETTDNLVVIDGNVYHNLMAYKGQQLTDIVHKRFNILPKNGLIFCFPSVTGK